MNFERMRELVGILAAAKSRQDVAGALAVQHPDMILETPAFGTRVQGKAANGDVLTGFFKVFPDYSVQLVS